MRHPLPRDLTAPSSALLVGAVSVFPLDFFRGSQRSDSTPPTPASTPSERTPAGAETSASILPTPRHTLAAAGCTDHAGHSGGGRGRRHHPAHSIQSNGSHTHTHCISLYLSVSLSLLVRLVSLYSRDYYYYYYYPYSYYYDYYYCECYHHMGNALSRRD